MNYNQKIKAIAEIKINTMTAKELEAIYKDHVFDLEWEDDQDEVDRLYKAVVENKKEPLLCPICQITPLIVRIDSATDFYLDENFEAYEPETILYDKNRGIQCLNCEEEISTNSTTENEDLVNIWNKFKTSSGLRGSVY